MTIVDGYRTTPSPKAVNRRKNRPVWASNDSSILQHAKTLRQWHIARMYWMENRPASNIAKELKTTVKAIESIVYRLTHS